MTFFVSFGAAVHAPAGDHARAVAIPERGAFFVVEGPGLAAFENGVDHGLRTSTRTEDVAEVLDGLHEELAARGTPVSFAMALREDDAVGFFGAGVCLACLTLHGITRTTIEPRDGHLFGAVDERGALVDAAHALRFFRAYVRAGTLIVLASEGAHRNRRRAQPPVTSLQRHADHLVDGPGSLAPAAAVVLRVDEEPRIR